MVSRLDGIEEADRELTDVWQQSRVAAFGVKPVREEAKEQLYLFVLRKEKCTLLFVTSTDKLF